MRPDQILREIEINRETGKKELERLNEHKAPGPDGIPNTVLRRCAEELAAPLEMEEGKIPNEWKQTRIVPIYKKGARCEPGNYRPVSLTSQVCKVMERLVKSAIMDHLEENELLTRHQHGFRKGKSCQSNLLEVLEDWTVVIDDGHGVDILFLDFQKAFDSVPHNRLAVKLNGYGIQGNLLDWIRFSKQTNAAGGSGIWMFGMGTGIKRSPSRIGFGPSLVSRLCK